MNIQDRFSKYKVWTGDAWGNGGVNAAVNTTRDDYLQTYIRDQESGQGNSGGFYGDSSSVAIDTSDFLNLVFVYDRGPGTDLETTDMDMSSVDFLTYGTVYPTFSFQSVNITGVDRTIVMGLTDIDDSCSTNLAFVTDVGQANVQTLLESYDSNYFRMHKIYYKDSEGIHILFDRIDKRLTIVDGNNLVLKDNVFIVEGCDATFTAGTSEDLEINFLATITEGTLFFEGDEIFFEGVADEEITHEVEAEGTYYVWVGINSSAEVITYLTEDYESPDYDPETELLMKCVKVFYYYPHITSIVETIDLVINNSYYGLGVESGLLDSFMNNSIKMIELQADNSLTPTSSENLKIDTFSDSNGYLNTVSSATATFDTNKYKRVTAVDETITLNISGVTANKTACQLYINQIDNEEDCEITYDIISSSSEEELDIPINEYHIIEAFNPTTSKLNGGYIRIHLKNNAAVPTSGYPSIKTYALKLW
jgi:hypothetical protein